MDSLPNGQLSRGASADMPPPSPPSQHPIHLHIVNDGDDGKSLTYTNRVLFEHLMGRGEVVFGRITINEISMISQEGRIISQEGRTYNEGVGGNCRVQRICIAGMSEA